MVLFHRVVAAATPGMTTKDPFNGEPAAFKGAIFGDGIYSVLGTGWREPARRL